MAQYRRKLLNKNVVMHDIKHNKTTSYPSNIIYLDTETKWRSTEQFEKHNLKLAWTCYVHDYETHCNKNGEWLQWVNEEALCEYIESKAYTKKVLWIFAHNAFFDMQIAGVNNYFQKWGWKLKFWYEKGTTYILSIRKESKCIKVVSTTNYFATTLKNIGKSIGVEKMDISFNKMCPAVLSIYCRNDVLIVKRFMENYFEFIEQNDLGNFAMTRGSQSMNCYRHRFMTTKITTHNDYELQQFERLCYMGGRTECYKIGVHDKSKYYTYDINSMYPYVMKTKQYPTRFVDMQDNVTIGKASKILKHYATCCKIRVKTLEPVYAVRRKSKIIYPVGIFDCYVCTDGLKYAIENKHVDKIYEMYLYEKDFIFVDYIDYFYNLRNEYKKHDNDIYQKYCKLFMNSLYGKFGQKRDKEVYESVDDDKMCYRIEIIDDISKEHGIETVFMNTKITKMGDECNDKAFVAIAAHVTEYSRLLLWDIIKTTGRDNVYYCDTDSIKVDEHGKCKIKYKIDENELGALKLEKQCSTFVVNSNKDYVEDGKVTLKGIPKDAVRVGKNKYEYRSWLNHIAHLRYGELNNYMRRRIVKTLKREYDKGHVLKNGNVKPFTLVYNALCPPLLSWLVHILIRFRIVSPDVLAKVFSAAE